MITAENITKTFKLYKSPADRLKEIVQTIDPSAMFIVSDVHEAIGEGFKKMGR